MTERIGDFAGMGVGLIQMAQRTAMQGSLAVGVAGGMQVLAHGIGLVGWEKANSFFDPILRAPVKMAEKLVEWMTPAEGASREGFDETTLKERAAILSTGVVAALSTLTAHVVCLGTAAFPLSPILLGVAFGVHSYVMSVLTDFTGERAEDPECAPLGRDTKLEDTEFTFAGFFDRQILKVNLIRDPSRTDAVDAVVIQWRIAAFAVASIALTSFLSTPVLACTVAYPLAALVGTVVRRYYQMGAPEIGDGMSGSGPYRGSHESSSYHYPSSSDLGATRGRPGSGYSQEFSGPSLQQRGASSSYYPSSYPSPTAAYDPASQGRRYAGADEGGSSPHVHFATHSLGGGGSRSLDDLDE